MAGVREDLEVKDPDPRAVAVEKRLRNVRRTLAVVSGKGGVGKSLVATSLSLLLAKGGCKVGLFDLDFHGPSCHVILGAKGTPHERRGIIPPRIQGIKFMSVVHYVGEKPLPLRGMEISDALLELLAVTRWGRLDWLIMDAPPGMGEEVLDLARLVEGAEFLVVTTPFRLAQETARRLLRLLQELKAPVVGIIENMCAVKAKSTGKLAEDFNVKYLGSIPFDPKLEGSIGNPKKLLKTRFASRLKALMKNLAFPDPTSHSVLPS